MKVIVRLRHNKEKEILKICKDFKITSESKGEPFEYKIENNKLIITRNRDIKQAYRRKRWFEKLNDLVIYAYIDKDGI